jgi:ABC-2 type transport system ATP-binding protein
MKQKVLIAAALLHDPDLLIFDEPESGLDLTAGLVLRHLILTLAARGKAILYCSHLLPLVERVCSSVLVLHRGRVAAEGPVDRLRGMVEGNASLEEVIAQMLANDNPELRARDIADLAAMRA